MIKLIYMIDSNDTPDEDAWLRDLKVYPSKQALVDPRDSSIKFQYGMIVAPEIASLIKMRHPLQYQHLYTSR